MSYFINLLKCVFHKSHCLESAPLPLWSVLKITKYSCVEWKDLLNSHALWFFLMNSWHITGECLASVFHCASLFQKAAPCGL